MKIMRKMLKRNLRLRSASHTIQKDTEVRFTNLKWAKPRLARSFLLTQAGMTWSSTSQPSSTGRENGAPTARDRKGRSQEAQAQQHGEDEALLSRRGGSVLFNQTLRTGAHKPALLISLFTVPWTLNSFAVTSCPIIAQVHNLSSALPLNKWRKFDFFNLIILK